MVISITWCDPEAPNIKLPGKRVNINKRWGVISDTGEHNDLWWHWRPDTSHRGVFELVLSAGKRVSSNELVKIAESAQY